MDPAESSPRILDNVDRFGLAAIARMICDFLPANEQEAADRDFILQRFARDPSVLERSSFAHVTVSAWTVDPAFERVLLIYHNLYDSWGWVGGHADGDDDLQSVALRELAEETGVENARVVSVGLGDLLSLEVLTVDGHEKRGKYVSSHLHLNITYLVVADPAQSIRIKADENSGVKWVPLDDILTLSSEPWMCDRVYRKLIDKTRSLKGA